MIKNNIFLLFVITNYENILRRNEILIKNNPNSDALHTY